MKLLLKNGKIFQSDSFVNKDIAVIDSEIFDIADLRPDMIFDREIDCDGKFVIPGLVDVHVHLREPGFLYKETVATGTAAAARGGYTAICAMPNLDPAPTDLKNLKVQLDTIKRDAKIKVYPYGAITADQSGRGKLSDMAEMAPYVIAFTDDGKGVQAQDLMEEAMTEAKRLGKLIVAHCEDESLLDGGYIHKGIYAEQHGHKGICSESEWKQVERDIELCKKTGCPYHVCHISTKETVELIRKAKAEGVDITCETAPHYLIFCDEDLKESGSFKMNPPIRGREDRAALIEGIKDGTVDMIATDHAPHSAEEKSKGLKGSNFGIVGLETAFPVLYKNLVLRGIISLEKLVDLMAVKPRERFKIPGGAVRTGQRADITVLDLESKSKVDPGAFCSMGHSTPFEGMDVQGETVMTIADGKIVWERN